MTSARQGDLFTPESQSDRFDDEAPTPGIAPTRTRCAPSFTRFGRSASGETVRGSRNRLRSTKHLPADDELTPEDEAAQLRFDFESDWPGSVRLDICVAQGSHGKSGSRRPCPAGRSVIGCSRPAALTGPRQCCSIGLANKHDGRELTPRTMRADIVEFAPPENLRVTPGKPGNCRSARPRAAGPLRSLPIPAPKRAARVTLVTGCGRHRLPNWRGCSRQRAIGWRWSTGTAIALRVGREIVPAGRHGPILITCDLEHRDAGETISAPAAAGVEVEFVVNNAGFGLFGHAAELDRAEQLGIIAVNILALTDVVAVAGSRSGPRRILNLTR